MNKRKISIIAFNVLLSAFLFGVFVFPTQTFGQANSTTINISLENPLGNTKRVEDFLTMILGGLATVLAPFIVIMLLWTGFLFVQAQGNPGEIEKARSSLLWTLVGAAIVMGAAGLSKVLQSTLGGLS